jgi:hypothetical protein
MKLKLSSWLIATWAMGACASPQIGYLACVGPAPLRFASVMRFSTNHFTMPLPVEDPKVEMPLPKVVTPAPPTQLGPTQPPVAIQDPVPAPQPFVQSAQPDGVVSPQMFLKYFNKPINGTNGTTSFVTPYGFTPPRTIEPSGSKATYSNGP